MFIPETSAKRQAGIKIALLLIGLVLFLPYAGFSQEAHLSSKDAHDLGALPLYLEKALANNPGLAALKDASLGAEKQVSQARALPDPKFSMGWYFQPVETRTGPQRSRYSLSQSFPWFGTRSLKADSASQKVLAVKALERKKRLEIIQEVKTAYYELAYSVHAEKILGENLELLRYLEKVVQAGYSAGKSGYAGLIRIQVLMDRIKDRRQSFEDRAKVFEARLLAAMDEPRKTPVSPPPAIPVMLMEIPEQELFRGILENNPAIAGLAHDRSAVKSQVRLSQKAYYPDMTLGLQVIDTEDARMPNVEGSGEDPIIGTLSFNIPLWQKKRDARLAQSRALLSRLNHEEKDLERRLMVQAEKALFQYRDAGKKLVLYKESLVPKARQALSVTLEAFQAGRARSQDVIEMEKTLLELELDHARFLKEQALAMARLETLYGREIPCAIHGSILDGDFPGLSSQPFSEKED